MKVIKSYNEMNSLSPKVIRAVLSDVDKLYPSKEKGLILWSHGTGWINVEYSRSRSFGQDSGETINLSDLSTALPSHYDYIIFDACYMSSIEMLCEMKLNADYIVGSPCVVPSDGIISVKSIMSLLNEMPLLGRLRSVCDIFINEHKNYRKDISISVCRTIGIYKLINEIKKVNTFDLSEEIISQIPSYRYNGNRVFF